MISLTSWLSKLDAEKILLVEIDPDGAPVYIADTSYITEPGDVPANQPYTPVIAQNGIPRLSRKIQEVFGGRSMASWGALELATPFVGDEDLAAVNLRGLPVNVLLTGPRAHVDHADAVTVLTGRIGVKSGNVDDSLTIEIEDDQASWDGVELPPNQYDGTESASFPVSNIGLSKPICLGLCRNVSGVLIDQSNFTYQFHDGSVAAMQSIDTVYDNGVAVSVTNVDLAAGTARLSAPPAGRITADVKGVKDGVTFIDDTASIIDWLALTFGGAPTIDITGLPIDTIGFYLNSRTNLSNTITRLMQGVFGWWGFDRLGVFKARLFQVPAGDGQSFGESKHISDLTWSEEDQLIWSVPLAYRYNWTALEPALSIDADTATWLRGDGYKTRVEDINIKNTCLHATTATLIQTYFDSKAAVDAVGARVLALFGVLRRRAQVSLPITDPMLELGGELTLADADVMDGDYILVGLADEWDGEIPLVNVELWG